MSVLQAGIDEDVVDLRGSADCREAQGHLRRAVERQLEAILPPVCMAAEGAHFESPVTVPTMNEVCRPATVYTTETATLDDAALFSAKKRK